MDKEIRTMVVQQLCRDLVLRSVAFVDDGNFSALSQLFSTTGILVRSNAEPIQGRTAILASYAQRPVERITRHLVSNILVDVDPHGRASGRSYVQLWSGSKSDPAGALGRPAQPGQNIGEFKDEFIWSPHGQWLIQRREIHFILRRDN